MTSNLTPGNVLKVTVMEDDEGQRLGYGVVDAKSVYGIVLDAETVMVFYELEQHGYRGANGNKWVSRVWPLHWIKEPTPIESSEVPDDVPSEFWPISAQAGLNGGV